MPTEPDANFDKAERLFAKDRGLNRKVFGTAKKFTSAERQANVVVKALFGAVEEQDEGTFETESKKLKVKLKEEDNQLKKLTGLFREKLRLNGRQRDAMKEIKCPSKPLGNATAHSAA
jgi:hypothetical protein